MPEETSIQVNFGKPIPLFPLDTVALLPQQVLPLHIFEERYRQMVGHALDGAGQIALGVFEGNRWKQEYHGRPPVRPAVCIGQILQHEKLPDGRYNLLVQGVCRARIIEEHPADGERLYRQVMLEPVGVESAETADLSEQRGALEEILSSGPLTMMTAAEPILEYVRNEQIPTHALLELISFTLINAPTLRYRLLEEPDAAARAGLILGELRSLARLLRRATPQKCGDCPKGCNWN